MNVQLPLRINFNSPEWAEFERWLQETELLDTYRQLANTETSSEKTEQLRGKAAFIMKLLGLKKSPLRNESGL